ncbi:MAG: endonuclease domain-containing protein [Thermoplasmataceae archaeon]|jgi:very-short-patch-repair endonuclease
MDDLLIPSSLEKLMKDALDKRDIGYSFQHPTRSGFIIDFAIIRNDKRLAIEVDGYYHQFRHKKDLFRDYVMRRGGWEILRFSPTDLENPDHCVDIILEHLK